MVESNYAHLLQKTNKKDPNNYRKINILNATLTLATRIIATKINERIVLHVHLAWMWFSY